MADVVNPMFGIDVAEQLRKRQLLQDMQNQQPTTQPQTQPAVDVNAPPPQGQTTITPWQQPEAPMSQFKPQIGAINQDIEGLAKRGTDLTTLAGQQPDRSQYKVSKLRAALLMPLQILAGAGGIDTSKEYGGLIRPGYNKAMSEYQRKMEAAQTGYSTMKDVLKDRLDALKAEGVITKDQEEALYHQAEVKYKTQELEKLPLEEDRIKAETELARARARAALAGRTSGNMAVRIFDRELQDYALSHGGQQPPLDAYEDMAAKSERLASLPVAERQQALKERELLRDSQKTARDNNKKVLDPIDVQMANLRGLGQTLVSGTRDQNKIAQTLAVIEAVSSLSNPLTRITRYNTKEIEALRQSPGRLEAAIATARNFLGKGSAVPPEVLKELKPFVDLQIDELKRQRDLYRKANEEIDKATTPEEANAAIARRDKALDDLYDLQRIESTPTPTTPTPAPGGKKLPSQDEVKKALEQKK